MEGVNQIQETERTVGGPGCASIVIADEGTADVD